MIVKSTKLSWENIVLRPIEYSDYEKIFQWHSDTENLHLWWTDRYVYSFEIFIEVFKRKVASNYLTAFIITVRNEEKITDVGLVYAYNANIIDKYSYICVYLEPTHTNQHIGVKAGFIICRYLFKYFGLRKIYAEVFEYNSPSSKILERNGFKSEAILQNHRWYDNKYWNLQIMALYRDDFDKKESEFESTVG